jgi:1,4-alpha-glucan branching enzyme
MAVARAPKKTENTAAARAATNTAAARAAAKRVTFKLIAPEAEQVVLAGSFNGWANDGTTLKRDAKGVWKTQVSLKPGRYEYRFRVDGHWRDDPECPARIPNGFGSENCIIEV